jgi:trk system potassium uptake protein TrkA
MPGSVHIVILGCGRVGSTLAHSLQDSGHSVSVIDQNPEAFRRLGPDFSGDTINGVGFEQRVLVEAGIERADAFAAVSSGDNSNIISARLARETFGVHKVVARIYDQKRADPTSTVALIEVLVHPGWIGHRLRAFEEATGVRVAYVNRFGVATLPTESTVVQDGDQVYVLVTDDLVAQVNKVAGAAPEGSL